MLRSLFARFRLTRDPAQLQLELGLAATRDPPPAPRPRATTRKERVMGEGATAAILDTGGDPRATAASGAPGPRGTVLTPPDYPRPANLATDLFDRLRAAGLRGIKTLRLTTNRTVVASFRGDVLRLHRAFANASDDVLRAVAVFVCGRGAARRAARRALLDYPIPRHTYGARTRSRRERAHADDVPLVARLVREHGRLNAERFNGILHTIPLRVSRRMRSRLGHYAPAASHGAAEIVISRRHIRRNGWPDALQTLLHEMVHQWQEESGLAVDHGPTFRRKAREVGVEPRARRVVR